MKYKAVIFDLFETEKCGKHIDDSTLAAITDKRGRRQ